MKIQRNTCTIRDLCLHRARPMCSTQRNSFAQILILVLAMPSFKTECSTRVSHQSHISRFVLKCSGQRIRLNRTSGQEERRERSLFISSWSLWRLCNFAYHLCRPYPLWVFFWAEENNPWNQIYPFLSFIRKDAEYKTCLVLPSMSPSNTSRWKESYHKVRT
jgi:hypothetical protein